MALDMYDAARDNPEVTALLLGSETPTSKRSF